MKKSLYANELEPTSTVKAIAKITLIDDEAIVPTLEPPTYSRQIYSGDFCQLAFSDEYLSGGTATADGETVPGVFTLNEEQEKYGYWERDGGLVQVGLLKLKVTFTPFDRLRFSTAECTVNVDVIPRKFRQANTSYIDNKKIGTAFEDLGLPNAFYFFAAADEPNHEGSGLDGNVPGIIKWDDSNYDPNSYEEQTIYGTVNRAEFEKYYIVPEGADLRGVVKITLQADPVDTEITQLPVFRWKNGDFTLPDNTMFVNRIFEMGATGGATANLADGVAKVKGTDTVVPGTFSFKEGTPGWFDELGENTVTVVFTPTDQHGYRTAETTIKVNVIKNTFKRCEEPNPITEKKLGTTFAGLNLPENVVVEAIDAARVGMEVSWDESSYDAQSTAWQTIPGTLVFDANDERKYQQPEPAVTAAIRVKLLGSEDAPAITTTTLPGGTVGTPYHHQLQATGGGFILWEFFSGELPKGLTLKQTTGEISGTPTAEGTAQFTVRALNSVGNDKKELSITITNAPAAEHTVTVTTAGGGTASASSTSATAGTEITLTAQPNADYRFKEWQVVIGNVTIANDKFAMPDGNVEIKAIFEQDAILTPVEHGVIVTTDGNGTASASPATASNGTEITLTAAPNEGYHFKEWQVIRGGVTIANNKFTMPDTNVEVKAIFEKDAPPAPVEHTVTVNTDGNGTASASPTMASAGTEITLTAQPNAGYHFKEWQVVSGNVTIANNKFAMPDGSVEIKAIFEQDAPPAPVEYAIIVTTDGNGTASANTSTASTGTEITLTAAPNAGYHFKEWQVVSGGVTIANDKFAMPDGSVMIKAIFEQDAPPAPVEHVVIVTTDGNGTASANTSTASTGTEITLTAAPNAGYHFKEWQVVSGGVTIANNKFAMPDGSVVIKAIFEQDAPPAPVEYIVTFDGNGGTPSVGSMTTTGQQLAALPGASRSGSYSFDGWYTQKSGGEKITTDTAFSANTAVYAHWTYTGGDDPSVTYYTLRFETGGGSDIASVRAKRDTYIDLTGYAPTWRGHTFIGWYSDRGLTNRVSGVYLTKHTTVYAGWRADESTGTGANPFTDVSEMDWFYGDVMFVYENGLMLGTGDTLFSPHDTATRGMMAAILWRMEGSPEPEGKNSFIDVETGAQYADAITWTAENGIFDGYVEEGFDGHSEDRFEPGRAHHPRTACGHILPLRGLQGIRFDRR